MSRVLLEIDHSLPKSELFKFLKDNKKALIAQKKATFKRFDGAPNFYSNFNVIEKDGTTKAVGDTVIPEDVDSIMVDVAANTSLWCDTAMDVLLRDSAKKSIRERKGLIPHIHDHLYEVLAEVGDVKNIFYQDVPLKQLGLKQEGTGQVLTFRTEIVKEYNEKIFHKYRLKKIKQHSIGLRYIELLLAINEPDDDYYEDEYKVWKKYFDQIINKEVPEERGFFWAVPQYMLLENSCVLIGANQLTPTLSTSEKQSTNEQPSDDDTEKGPEDNVVFDVEEALKTVKFF
jgi:hypothetical protein